MEPGPHPSKEEVRAWMVRRCRAHLPPPAPDEIRRELGWHLLPAPDVPALPPVPPPPPQVPLLLAEMAALTAVIWCALTLYPAGRQR
ncbi:hypothetical protein IP92_00566 [Pseudoduganella flava]|uniref:Uncharacterized protein n=1 Tax=Pseudoduganella flava TaxID=871742 RepID=A0A562Q495_9BURK|nr:hypothetical protein [Pseudoduganella flava]QGZ41595.1 hypothetical protein GO485_22760 [Pseudoduganella flava]TWI51579.1 hypothetical protein IP92_00566 [Pseudoduganella flava]